MESKQQFVYCVYDGRHLAGICSTIEKAKEIWGQLPAREITQAIESVPLDKWLSRWDTMVEVAK